MFRRNIQGCSNNKPFVQSLFAIVGLPESCKPGIIAGIGFLVTAHQIRAYVAKHQQQPPGPRPRQGDGRQQQTDGAIRQACRCSTDRSGGEINASPGRPGCDPISRGTSLPFPRHAGGQLQAGPGHGARQPASVAILKTSGPARKVSFAGRGRSIVGRERGKGTYPAQAATVQKQPGEIDVSGRRGGKTSS